MSSKCDLSYHARDPHGESPSSGIDEEPENVVLKYIKIHLSSLNFTNFTDIGIILYFIYK